MDLKETDILGDVIGNHWYYRSKSAAVEKLLKDIDIETVLDVGAGSGFFSKFLLSATDAETAWCVDTGYDAEFDETLAGKSLHYRRAIETLDADVVLLMDVLEHVDNDVGLLKGYAEKVPGGTVFLISVPAFDWLWSGHDVYLGHKRRYTLPQIEDTVRRAGLTVQTGVYYFGAVFPLAAFLRMAQKCFQGHTRPGRSQLKQHSRIVNELLARLSHLELFWMNRNRLAGLTVFCLARAD